MRYIQRSVKYFLSLVITYVAVVSAMTFVTMEYITPGDRLQIMATTPRGVFLLIAVIAISAAYPFFGFMKRVLPANIVVDRESIDRAFSSRGFIIWREDYGSGKLTYRAANLFKRAGMLFEDHITVRQLADGKIELSGNRKAVAYVLFRLEGLMYKAQNSNQE